MSLLKENFSNYSKTNQYSVGRSGSFETQASSSYMILDQVPNAPKLKAIPSNGAPRYALPIHDGGWKLSNNILNNFKIKLPF